MLLISLLVRMKAVEAQNIDEILNQTASSFRTGTGKKILYRMLPIISEKYKCCEA